jgi:chromosome segregation ATPase
MASLFAGVGGDATSEHLPPHMMSAANKELAAQIASLQAEVEKVGRETDDHKRRLQFMAEHLTNVKAEIASTQQLQDAKRREIESQDHMTQLAERERGRLKQRLEQLNVRRRDLQDQSDAVQNRIFQSNIRMDELKAAMNFNEEELEQWDAARRQKEDDGSALARYQKADQAAITHLLPQVEKLEAAIQARRRELENEITDTRAAQIELDKTAGDFKALHEERHGLLQQWEEAVKAMHRRDAAIQAAADRYTEGKAWIDKRQRTLKGRKEFLQAELTSTRDMGVRIEEEDRQLAKYREDHSELHRHLQSLDDEVETVRSSLGKCVKDRAITFTAKEGNAEALQVAVANHQRLEAKRDRLRDKVERDLAAATDLTTQSKLVADLLAETERSMKELDKEMNRVKDEQYRRGQELFEVRRVQADLLAEISGAQAQGKNMSAKIAQLDNTAFKQQELLYSIDFNVQQMERRVNRAKGERTEEERNELQEKIDMLQKMVEDLEKQHKVLETQVTRVTDDLRHAKAETKLLEKDKARFADVLLELTLENESCQTENGVMTRRREQVLVDGDVLRLQVEGLKRLIRMRDGELHGLENRKQQLELTIAERDAEISVHHEVLRQEAKGADEERRRVMAELRERQAQVKALKNRYEVLIGRMEKGAAEQTHAQHIVRTAQEREELQIHGDALDANIKKTERELRKLEKTVAALKGSNAEFKHMFTKVGDDDEEVRQQKLLRTKHSELQTIVNRRAHEAKDMLRSQLDAQAVMQQRAGERGEVDAQIAATREQVAAVAAELREQLDMIGRYQAAIAKAVRMTEPDIVADVRLLETKEALQADVAAVSKLALSRGEDVANAVVASLRQHGLASLL